MKNPESIYKAAYADMMAGRMNDAREKVNATLAIAPDHVEALNLCGVLHKNAMELDTAASVLTEALAVCPTHPEATMNLAYTKYLQGDSEGAINLATQACALRPMHAPFWANLGNLLKNDKKPHGALRAALKGLNADPKSAACYHLAAMALRELALLPEALENHGRAISLDPGNLKYWSSYLYTLNYHPDFDADMVAAAYRQFRTNFSGTPQSSVKPTRQLETEDCRVTVAYMSGDFRSHSVSQFLLPVLRHHDQNRFRILCISQSPQKDEVTNWIQQHVDGWIEGYRYDDSSLCERLHELGIDVLVDLAGHTAGSRLGVLARRPTPSSVTWIGYNATTGLPEVDWFLSDAHLTPAGSEDLFAESIWRLDRFPFVWNPPPFDLSADTDRSGDIVFGSLTRLPRLNDRVLDCWAQVLLNVPSSRLLLDNRVFAEPETAALVYKRLAKRGIPEGSVELRASSSRETALATYKQIDIVLDQFPHNSGTTLFEALWMGVPFITMADRPAVGRLGSAILNAMGMNEWIATNVSEYLDISMKKARQVEDLRKGRDALRKRLLNSDICDGPGFTRSYETALLEMLGQ